MLAGPRDGLEKFFQNFSSDEWRVVSGEFFWEAKEGKPRRRGVRSQGSVRRDLGRFTETEETEKPRRHRGTKEREGGREMGSIGEIGKMGSRRAKPKEQKVGCRGGGAVRSVKGGWVAHRAGAMCRCA